MPEASERENSSAGHKLGQLVGDWFQDSFVMPLLQEAAERLDLFLDHRRCARLPAVRGDKINWRDEDGHEVDYDFVLELGGSAESRGVPVAFLECFWRRGARHSKDKARDDSGKLAPMRIAYPTARFLGIIASGEFTAPAREYVRSRNINLFYVPKAKVIQAFAHHGLQMDYPDSASEEQKAQIADRFGSSLSDPLKAQAASVLRELIGETAVTSYVTALQSALSSPPQEFKIVGFQSSSPLVFETVGEVSRTLNKPSLGLTYANAPESYSYQVSYGDGTEFEKEVSSLDELRELHGSIAQLSSHMAAVAPRA